MGYSDSTIQLPNSDKNKIISKWIKDVDFDAPLTWGGRVRHDGNLLIPISSRDLLNCLRGLEIITSNPTFGDGSGIESLSPKLIDYLKDGSGQMGSSVYADISYLTWPQLNGLVNQWMEKRKTDWLDSIIDSILHFEQNNNAVPGFEVEWATHEIQFEVVFADISLWMSLHPYEWHVVTELLKAASLEGLESQLYSLLEGNKDETPDHDMAFFVQKRVQELFRCTQSGSQWVDRVLGHRKVIRDSEEGCNLRDEAFDFILAEYAKVDQLID